MQRGTLKWQKTQFNNVTVTMRCSVDGERRTCDALVEVILRMYVPIEYTV